MADNPDFGKRPCLHCVLEATFLEFIKKNPWYPPQEAVVDMITVLTDLLQQTAKAGVDMEGIPGLVTLGPGEVIEKVQTRKTH